jgi:hypothetical protein
MTQRLVSGCGRFSTASGLPVGPVTPFGLLGRSDMIKDSPLGMPQNRATSNNQDQSRKLSAYLTTNVNK